MNNSKSLLLLLFVFAQSSFVFSQDTLTYETCVQTALENNHGILIIKNKQQIAKNNATAGNVNLLPKLSLNAGVNGGLTNVNQQFITQKEANEVRGAQATSENASLNLSYMLYQGNTRTNQLKKLRVQSQVSELETKQKIEETMVAIGQIYYQIASTQAQVSLSTEVLGVSHERFVRIKYKYEYGSALKIDLLNAEVSLNADSVNYMLVNRTVNQLKQDLMVVMGQSPRTDYFVDGTTSFLSLLDRESLKSALEKNNTALRLSEGKITTAQYNLAIAKGRRHPVLSSELAYGWQGSQSDAGILKSNTSNGLNGGLRLTFDLFDGKKKEIQVQNSRLQLHSAQQGLKQQNLSLNRELENLWATYIFQLNLLRLQTRNSETNRLNFERSKELFDFGQLTATQYREAQVNYLTARYNLIVSNTSAKIAEINLLRLSGQLVK